MSDDAIRSEIEQQLQPPTLPAAVSIQRGDDELLTPALLYRLRHNGCVYTAVVVHGTEQPGPVVTTVYPTDERLREVEKAVMGKWRDSRHLVRLRYLRTWPFTPQECAIILHQSPAVIEEYWDEAGRKDRRCATCVYYDRAMHECMELDIPVAPGDTACDRYEENFWEMVRLAQRAKIPPEILEQAKQMRAQDPPLSWREIGARLGYPEITIWRRIREAEENEGDSEMPGSKVTDELLAEARRMRAEGKSWRGIGRELGVSDRTLREHLGKEETSIESPKPEQPTREPKPFPPAAICAEPVCDTCVHRPVCRYQETYRQHQEWALCKWWRLEGAA